jgi:hypothetical protein
LLVQKIIESSEEKRRKGEKEKRVFNSMENEVQK